MPPSSIPRERYSASVENTDLEASADLLGSNSFHRLADRKARPAVIPFGWRLILGQKFTDLLITDLDTSVFSAEPSHLCHPVQQRFSIDLAVRSSTRNAPDLTKEIIGGGGEFEAALRVFDPPFWGILPVVVTSWTQEPVHLNEEGRRLSNLPLQIGDAVFTMIKGRYE